MLNDSGQELKTLYVYFKNHMVGYCSICWNPEDRFQSLENINCETDACYGSFNLKPRTTELLYLG